MILIFTILIFERSKYTQIVQVYKNEIVNLKPDFDLTMENLFVYGTLQFPQIVKRLTGNVFKATPATLTGYKRCLVKGCDYPAVFKNAHSKVNGMLLENVDEISMQQILFFEGNEYEKIKVRVIAGDRTTDAFTFVWKNDVDLLEDTDWDQEEFEKESLQKYS